MDDLVTVALVSVSFLVGAIGSLLLIKATFTPEKIANMLMDSVDIAVSDEKFVRDVQFLGANFGAGVKASMGGGKGGARMGKWDVVGALINGAFPGAVTQQAAEVAQNGANAQQLKI